MTTRLILEICNVRHVYATGSNGLAGCSLNIRQGSRNALLGANGSGKTTLLQQLNGLLRPTSGAILIDGAPLDYSRNGLAALRRRVGLVFQNPDRQLFSASVCEDVSFGPLNLGLDEAEVRERVAQSLAAVGMTAMAERPVHHLSFGQKKRVCIAGASYGGYAAMRGAQRDGKLFRCAISYAGVSDLGALARYDSQSLLGAEYRADLKEKAPDFDAVSPLRHPEEFSTPILIMHGKLDLRVPVKQSRDMAEKLKDAGKNYRYVEQPLGDHHFSREADRLQFLKEMDAFLQQYNPS